MKKLLSLMFILIVGVSVISCNVKPTGNTTTINSNIVKIFTLSELAQYDGSNGSTAYIAVNGTVYDVTNVFVDGVHQGLHLGGTDATSAFASSPHSMSLLDTLPVVGTLEVNDSIINNNSPTSSTTTQATTTQGTTTQETTQGITTRTMPIFTLSELSQYTGGNGTTAYIAVNGVVYDVTNVFVNGTHQGLQLGGTDATDAFASSPHSMSLLDTLTVVGTLEGYNPIVINNSQTSTSTTTQYNYDDDDEHDDDDDEHDD